MLQIVKIFLQKTASPHCLQYQEFRKNLEKMVSLKSAVILVWSLTARERLTRMASSRLPLVSRLSSKCQHHSPFISLKSLAHGIVCACCHGNAPYLLNPFGYRAFFTSQVSNFFLLNFWDCCVFGHVPLTLTVDMGTGPGP